MKKNIDPNNLPKSKLDYHYYTLGRILFFLAENGLSKIDFNPSNAMEVMDYREGNEEDVLKAFSGVLRFMIKEGVIRADNIQEYEGGYFFNGVQLTSKGLVLVQTNASTIDTALTGSISANTASAPALSTDTSYYGKWGEFAGSLIASATKSFGGG